jgi:phosphate transport system substrate-binding protein
MKKFVAGIATLGLLFSVAVNAGEVLVKGSDTLLNLVQRMSESFSEVQPDITVSVTGGGSGVGINALVNGEIDIADASREIKSKEIYSARENGVNPTQIVIAIDGLSVIVNEANTVEQLTVEEIGAIYRGEIKKWSDVGGPNRPITLYGRQPSSGTFVFFRDEVVKGEYAIAMRQMNGNSQIVEAVKSDETGIGYVGVGYLREATGVTALAVKSGDGDYVSPLDREQVYAGLYPLTRPLNQYTNGSPTGEARTFIEFELSEEGQQIVEEEGFFPVTADYIESNAAALGE